MSEPKTKPRFEVKSTEIVHQPRTIPGFFSILLRILVLIIFVISVFAVLDHIYYQNRVYPGVRIENYDVGGKTLNEARKLLEKEIKMIINEKYIHFPKIEGSGEDYLAATFREAGFEVHWEDALKKAINNGRMETVFDLAVGHPVMRYKIFRERPTYQIDLSLAEEIFNNLLTDLNDKVKIEPENAYAAIKDDDIYIMREKTGLKLDFEKTTENIMDLWNRFLWGKDNARPFHVEAALRPWPAEVTYTELRELNISTVIGAFSTNLGGSDDNRLHNVELASEKVHNTFLLPGELFSFNEVVGRANEAAGYLSAPIIVDGELVPGIGGGICQVSTTLYNTAEKAGMNVTERYPHSQPVSYVEEGRDAAISYPYLDLKFKNTLAYPVLIAVEIENNIITINMYGPEYSS